MVITSMSESSQSMRLVATMEVTRKPAMEEGPPPKVLGAAPRVQFLEWPRTRFLFLTYQSDSHHILTSLYLCTSLVATRSFAYFFECIHV